MKYRVYACCLAVLGILSGCRNDDDGLEGIAARDRGEQAIADAAFFAEYLSTHFYNYEEFEAEEAGFDYRIKFGKIEGDNADKIPLSDQVQEISVSRTEVVQSIYVLKAREGAGEQITYADSALTTFRGVELGEDTENTIDGSTIPTWFNLPTIIEGFYQGLSTTRAGTGVTILPNGEPQFNNDYGITAVFIPSGLGYFADPPGGSDIGLYANFVFTAETYQRKKTDHDGDLIPSIMEDLNDNMFLFDEEEDNTDGDAVPNFRDPDDDNDGVRSRLEIITEEIDTDDDNVPDTTVFVSFMDTDGDGIFDHLDTDDDNDGRDTVDEIEINFNTGVINYPDTDGDGTPDYLDSDS